MNVGVGDFIALGTLAWRVYRLCKDSSDEFKRISTQLESLHIALLETQEHLEDDLQLSRTRKDRLAKLHGNVTDTLSELAALLERYDNMSTPSQNAWDKMRFGMQDVSSIRDRIISATTELQVLNQLIHNSSQKLINKKLDRLLKEVRAGYRQGSCVSVQTVDSIDNTSTWKDLCKELESVGLTTAAITENHDYIVSWFKDAIEKGLLEEQEPSANPFLNSLTPLSECTTLLSATSAEPQKRKHSEGAISFKSTVSGKSDVSLKKKSRIASIGFKVFGSDTLLLDAASDGDVERVAELINKGANVNVKDRWGWRPMSMAAYGGHDEIAHLLLCAGADLDYKDVDGDSPLQLATNKGHTAVALMIEEELQERARTVVS